MAAAKREDLIESAVRFLKDPKVQSSPLAKRISFLETKGMTSAEIEDALARMNGTSASTSTPQAAAATTAPQHQQEQVGYPQGPYQPYPQQSSIPIGVSGQPIPGYPYYGPVPLTAVVPQKEPWSWKDYTLAGVSAAGLSYGAFLIIKNYISPHIAWPSPTSLSAESDKITQSLEGAKTALVAVQNETQAVSKQVSENALQVGSQIESIQKYLEELKEMDEKRDDEVRRIRDDVDSIKLMIPKMLEKSKESQNSALSDLQNELKSLKNLLLNRRIPYGAGAASGAPSEDASSSADQFAPGTPPFAPYTPNGVSSYAACAPVSKPAIPSWQMEAATARSTPGGSEE
ncbi:peroxisomal membrane anchor protein conserved region-domain-containing protein [Cladochytrium replicatum]|nr:peroxisomal membrane anchor protein conserved region-domain-containing protein [Cladochytrium replicatum]